MKRYFLIALFFPLFLFSQQKKGKEWFLVDSVKESSLSPQDKYILDSILPLYHKTSVDTIKLKHLYYLAGTLGDENLWPRYNRLMYNLSLKGGDDKVYLGYKAEAINNFGYYETNLNGNFETGIKYYKEALKIQEKLNNLRSTAVILNNIADIYSKNGDSDKAVEFHLKSLKIKEQVNDVDGIGVSYLNLGLIYKTKGDLPGAISCYSKALKIFEKEGNKRSEGLTLNNLAKIYIVQGDTNEAIQHFSKATFIFEKIGEKQALATMYGNLAQIYERIDTKKALMYQRKGMKLREDIGDIAGLGASYLGLARIYEVDKNDSSLIFIRNSIKYYEEANNKIGMATALEEAGILYHHRNDETRAEQYCLKSLNLAKEIGFAEMIDHTSWTLYSIYKKKGMKDKALDMYELYNKMHDSLYRMENKKAMMRQQFKHEYDKKVAADSVAQVESFRVEQERHDHEIARQRMYTYGGIVGFILMLMIAFISFRAFKNKQQANKEITHQKHIIEEKQKEILDSINYAKRIQYTLLAHDEYLNQNLGENFVLFKPKDIVSGDFYWATSVRSSEFGVRSDVPGKKLSEQRTINSERFYLAVCDSTGHGVPGAFMSLLNISFLNEAINEKGILEPNEVLNYVRKRLIESISKDEQKDGFDGVLVCFEHSSFEGGGRRPGDVSETKISYAAANTSPLLFSNNQLLELPYDKMPVGQGERMNSFTLHKVDHKQGNILYVGTDGYVDQFGGANGKKFKYRRLCDTLKQNAALNLNAQKNVLEITFNDWKGNLDQVDDVLIIGVKL